MLPALLAFSPGPAEETIVNLDGAAGFYVPEPAHHPLVTPRGSDYRNVHPLALNARKGGDPDPKRTFELCGSCHVLDQEWRVVDHEESPLHDRISADRDVWAEEINLTAKCASCHNLVQPNDVPKNRWQDVINHMKRVFEIREWPLTFTNEEWLDVMHYYVTGADDFTELPPDPKIGPLHFSPRNVGDPVRAEGTNKIGNINIVDLDRDGSLDIVATDFDKASVVWLHQVDGAWVEDGLGNASFPATTEVFDFNGDGHLDIAFSSLGSMWPSDDSVGSAYLLINDGAMNFTRKKIVGKMGRMADVRPGDFDNDGDIDFAIASFGFLKIGEVGWAEQKDDLTFEYHRLSPMTGGVNMIPTDLNGDGNLDIVGLIAQEHEEIIAFMNKGGGEFEQKLIFKAFSPLYGSSGISLVDLDGDGDDDILYTNGDAVDLPQPMILPYHGVQWLENKGDLEYEHHSIFNFYGAYSAAAGDMDNDGDLDVAVVTMVNDWEDPTRMSAVWLENDGKQNFTPHGIGGSPINLVSIDLGDMDGDGDLDIITGSLNLFNVTPERAGRITVWTNEGNEP